MKAERRWLAELGLNAARLAVRGLKPVAEARSLAFAGLGTDGRDKFLTPATARAWAAMKAAAARKEVTLLLVSGFRSVEFQAALLRQKRERGVALADILRVNAPPGYSEHHSGRAVDIGTPNCAPLDEAFEATAAFRWLERNARRFGFTLSYPRNNRQGYVYEPWHWLYSKPKRP